jgi:peptidoglycan/LPS O-acetylase OafA/YrhL
MPDALKISGELKSGRIPSLDGLRAVAVILVLFAHAHQTRGFPSAHWLKAIGEHAAVGVEIFFVISGFLITTLMLREIDRGGSLGIRRFYLRRVLRIMPAYACLLGVVALMCLLGATHLSRSDWLAATTYTVNFLPHPAWDIGHAWSLSIEEHFYLLWPLAMAVGGAVFSRRLAVGIIGGCFLLRWVVLLAFPKYSAMAELWTFTRLDTIAFGCLLALLIRDPLWRQKLSRLADNSLLIAAAFIGLIISLALSSVSGKFDVGISFSANALCITFLVWAMIRHSQSRVGKFLNGRVLTAIGVGSYSLYLWQQIFLDRGKSEWVYRFPQNLLLAAAAAAISYFLIEKPFLILKDRISRPSRPTVGRPENYPAPAAARSSLASPSQTAMPSAATST